MLNIPVNPAVFLKAYATVTIQRLLLTAKSILYLFIPVSGVSFKLYHNFFFSLFKCPSQNLSEPVSRLRLVIQYIYPSHIRSRRRDQSLVPMKITFSLLLCPTEPILTSLPQSLNWKPFFLFVASTTQTCVHAKAFHYSNDCT